MVAKQANPAPPLVLTLDIGTSSVRAMIWDRTGDWVPGLEAQIKHHMRATPDGGVETDPEALFRRVVRCLDEILKLAGRQAGAIRAVGISTFWHSLLGLDGTGHVETPVYTWADTRSRGAVRQLKQQLDEQAVHERTGCPLHSSYLPAKLLWLSQDQPEVFGRVSHWMSFDQYCFLKLFEQPVISLSMASGTGLLNQDSCTWDDQILAALPVTAKELGRLVDAPDAVSALQGAWGKRWPVLRDLPWFPALGDGSCSNAGSGCATEKRVALSVGTSGALRILWKASKVAVPPGLWRYRLDRDHILAGGALSNGGNLEDWLWRTLRLGQRRDLAKVFRSSAPDGQGLTVLPFLAGERSPGYHDDARAVIVGMRLSTTPAEIMQASLEAVSYRFGLLDRLLQQVVPGTEEIIVNGGAILHQPAWMQITADVLGRRLIASEEAEATSRGAALMALQSLGELPAIEAATDRLGAVYEPDPTRHAVYQRGLDRQQQLYDLILATSSAAKDEGHDV